MEPIKTKLQKVQRISFTAADIEILADCCNMLIDKVNELVMEVDRLKKEKEYLPRLQTLPPAERERYLLGRWNIPKEGENHG